MSADVPTLDVLGVPVAQLSVPAAVDVAAALAEADGPSLLVYVNAHTLNLAAVDPAFHDVLRRADLVLNDGAGLAIAGRLLGSPFPANLNGTDFTVRILEAAASRGWSVWFHGARPGVAAAAGERLGERLPGLVVAGTSHGYVPDEELPALVERIAEAGTDVLVVGMGNPLQEHWLERHLPATGARLGVAVGAFLDFSAGEVRRAPAWMNRAGIEWIWRLAQEPGRLWRRYVVGNPVFLWRIGREALARRRRG